MISVVLPVYNTKEEYLREALESILNQTYQNFELLIINDASNKEVVEVLKSYTDSRIQIFTNPINLGITKSLNIGLKNAKGKYIARMDADDISLKDRFEQQLSYMEQHPKTIVLGSLAKIVDSEDIKGESLNIDREVRRIQLSFYNKGVIHPTAFMRREMIINHRLYYDEEIPKAQDYELWTRCIEVGSIDVLPKVLLKYRIHQGQISMEMRETQNYFRDVIKLRMLEKLGEFSQEEKETYLSLTCSNQEVNIKKYLDLTEKLLNRNKEKTIYSQSLYKLELRRLICKAIKKDKQNLWQDWRQIQFIYPNTLLYFFYKEFIKIKMKRRSKTIGRE